MNNINVRVVGTANVSGMTGPIAKLQAQVTALNAQLAHMVELQNGVDPAGYERMTRAARDNSRMFRAAAASTGMFEVQQLKVNSATDDYVKRLKKQQISFRQMMKERKVAAAAYREQLAMENMVVRQNAGGTTSRGKSMLDVMIPREVAAEANTAGKRIAWLNEQVKSGANQMVNWGKNTQWAGRQLTVGITMPILAAGAAAGVMAYQIDKELTRVQKVYDTYADQTSTNANEMKRAESELARVREASFQTAIKSAREYGAAGTDTLNVQAELAATGKRGADLQNSTAEVMRISRLGELEYQDAIKATISLQSVFRMSNKELTETFDYMNSVENATSLQTQDFATAIPIAAGAVRDMGGDVKTLGLLMTAMKERGIDAAQGANAIKALQQRLFRASPQIRAEFESLTGAKIQNIVKESGGNIITILQRINDVTKDLGDVEKTQVFAGLFGSYQVTRMKALIAGMGDLENGVGQVSTAFDLAGKSSDYHAKQAAKEIKTYKDSISGQWDTALKELQLQATQFGEPFVKAGTMALNVVTKLMKVINSLPDGVKNTMALALGFAAIAGPAIMLTGLFFNMVGMTLKMITSMVRLGTTMNIVDKESRAAAMAAKLTSKGYADQSTQAALLTLELKKLAAAQAAANRYTNAQRITQLTNSGLSQAEASARVAAEAAQDRKNAGLSDADAGSTVLANNTAGAGKEADKATKSYKRLAAGVGAGALAAGLLFSNTDSTLGKAATLILTASMLGPMLTPLGGLLKKPFDTAITRAKLLGTTMKTNLATARSTAAVSMLPAGMTSKGRAAKAAANGAGEAAATAASAAAMTKTTKLVTLAKSFGKYIFMGFKGIARFLGPVGLVITALTAGWSIYKLFRRDEEAAEKKRQASIKAQREGAEAIATASKRYAEFTGSAYKNLAGLTAISMIPGNDTQAEQERRQQFYTKDETGKGLVTSLKSAGDRGGDSEQYAIAQERFWRLQKENGLGAKEAAREIKAMYIAAGIGANDADEAAAKLLNTIGDVKNSSKGTSVVLKDGIKRVLGLDDPKAVSTEAENIAVLFENAFVSSSRRSAGYVSQTLVDSVSGGYATAFDKLPELAKKALGTININDADSFQKLMESYYNGDKGAINTLKNLQNELMESTDSDLRDFGLSLFQSGSDVESYLKGATGSVGAFEKSIVASLAESAGLEGKYASIAEILKDPVFQSKLNPFDEKQLDTFKAKVQGVQAAAKMPIGARGAFDTQVYRDKERASLMAEALRNLKAGGVETSKIKNLNQAQVALQKMINNEIGNTPNKLSRAQMAAKAFSDALSSGFKGLKGADAWSAYQTGMAGVQQDIADDMRESFDNNMNSSLEARQNMWDQRSEALSNEMDRRQEAMDKKWERKNNRAENYWDNRVASVDKAIKAEQKAEDLRERMFDNEIARIERLNDAQNRNINFNSALNSGDLDEAARIRNDAEAATATTALQRAANAGSAASDRRVDALEGRKENIEKARKRYMNALKKREDAQKKSLDRMRKARERSLANESKNDMNTQRKIWESRKKSLEQQMELFLAFTAGNEKQLKKHMKRVGLSYTEFGNKVLKPKGESWSQYFGNRLHAHMRKASLAIASDKMWVNLGKTSAKNMLKGIGFDSMSAFRYFVKTGEFKEKSQSSDGGTQKSTTRTKNPTRGKAPLLARHEGGVINNALGSRKGVPRTTKGLHRSEQMVLAQKGEFMVNKKSSSMYRDVLEQINSGRARPGTSTKPGVGGGGTMPGLAGVMAGAVNTMFLAGAKQAISNAYTKAAAKSSAAGGSYAAGKGGRYSDRDFSGTQLQNAAIIANVGSKMGMSKRDIMIGIMTAITESGLINVKYGDRDSQGLFQQRPSQGWGSVAQVTDPQYASRKFFEALKKVGDRKDMTPWLAAQAVQRSFDSSGANYKQYWDNASAIYSKGLTKFEGGTGKGFKMGAGGWHRASAPGKGWSNSHDYRNGLGSPLYAVGDGTVVDSRAITSGGSPGNGLYGGKYRSYGETIALNVGGDVVRYAHLSPGKRFVRKGQRVSGGSLIGLSGMTGNASGPHTHFDVNGNYDALGWFKKHGIGLATGGFTKNDGIANLHKHEVVISKDRTQKLYEGIDSFHDATVSNKGLPGMPGSPATPATSPSTTPINESGNKGKGIRTAAYNVWQKAPNAKTLEDLKRIANFADIMSLAEYRPYKARVVNPLLSKMGWGVTGVNPSGTAIAWNRKQYKLLKSGVQSLGDKRIAGMGGERKWSPYGLFQPVDGGRKFWQVAAHTIAQPHRGKAQSARRTQQFRALNALQKRLSKTAPVIMAGDFNSGYLKKNDNDALRAIGLNGARYSGASTMDDRQTYHDQILTSKGVKRVGDYTVLAKGMTSDHNALISRYQIPSLKVGGEIRYDNTLTNLHKKEKVLTAPLSAKLDEGLTNFANGAGGSYTDARVFQINIPEGMDNKEEVAKYVMDFIARKESRKPKKRSA